MKCAVTEQDCSLSCKSVDRRHLVNRLNYLNFQGRTVLISLLHIPTQLPLLLAAGPLPCAGERLECSWVEREGMRQLLMTHRFRSLLIPDPTALLVADCDQCTMSEEGISLLLPETARACRRRGIKREAGCGIRAEVTQNGALFEGKLVDFTPVAIRVEGDAVPPESASWFNRERRMNLLLFAGGTLIFSGDCELVRDDLMPQGWTFVLRPLENHIRRFAPKKYRNLRQQLLPSPSAVFIHPLSSRTTCLKIGKISGSGFSLSEGDETSVLVVGMIIPELELNFGAGLSVLCRAQVVSREVEDQGVTSGIAVLDMAMVEQLKLLSVLHQAADTSSSISSVVDLDALWEFFFDTGFIYPQKYLSLAGSKEEIKNTYRKLYRGNPLIARHFVYQRKGVILGHMSMVRFHENSWLIQHHAARKLLSIKAGLSVLNQVSRYLNELHNLYGAHIRYIFCYFRPDNRLPDRIFGGAARHIADQERCSLDRFAYTVFQLEGEPVLPFPEPWELGIADAGDVAELANYYRNRSGGLLMEAFALEAGEKGELEVAQLYRSCGFHKERELFALRKEGRVSLVAVTDRTDAGFNLSELTNCVTVFILDETLPPPMLEATLGFLSRHYHGHRMPVLTYPLSYLERQSIPFQKVYLLWILDLRHIDAYFDFFNRLLKSGRQRNEQEP